MPDKFSVYIITKMMALGYQVTAKASSNMFSSIRFKPQNTMQPFSVIYLKNRIDTDGLSYLFQNIPDHLLIVVDSDLMSAESVGLKQWFRSLHALYYGRVYVWDGAGVVPVHYDRQSGSFSNGDYVEIKSVRFERVDCLYSGFKGLYNVVLFNDRKFWSDAAKPPSRDTKTNPNEDFWRSAYTASAEAQEAGQPRQSQRAESRAKTEHFRREQAQREEQRKRDEETRRAREREDVFRDFRDAFERNKARYGSNNGGAYDPNAYPQYARGGVSGDKWFMQIWSDGTKDGAKKAYRALGLQYHPDINKEPSATEIMQAINRAYEKVMEIHNG